MIFKWIDMILWPSAAYLGHKYIETQDPIIISLGGLILVLLIGSVYTDRATSKITKTQIEIVSMLEERIKKLERGI